jgi:hypothetical protein
MSAVEDANREIRVAAIKAMARGICSQFGPKPGCFCGGSERKCHATILYHDFGMYALLGMEKEGFFVMKLPVITEKALINEPDKPGTSAEDDTGEPADSLGHGDDRADG